MRAYGDHGFLRSELGDLGVQILSFFGWEEAVEVVLACADDVRHRALECSCHSAEAAAYHVCHLERFDWKLEEGWDVFDGLCCCFGGTAFESECLEQQAFL